MRVESGFAEHVAGLRCEDLSSDVLESFDRLLLDTVAAVLSGVANDECRKIVGCLLEGEVGGPSSVAGGENTVGAARAAFANAIYAHWCEWDDVHDAAGIHGSAVIFPALLAAAEAAGRGSGERAGAEFVAAVVGAYDVAVRIAETLKPNSHHGWMPTGAAAGVGAAAGAARLFGLDAAGIFSAMGIAASGAGLFRQALADRTSAKNVLCGLAARNAVDGAELARAGVTGAPNFFTGPFGLNALHTEGRGDPRLALVDLGTRFAINGGCIKPYPSCRSTHPPLDVIFDLLTEEPTIGDQVESVHFIVPELLHALCGRPFEPGDNPRVSAQFSIPFTAALMLTRGRITPRDFLPERVLAVTAERADLISRITVEPVPDKPGAGGVMVPVTARIRLKNGPTIERSVDVVRGSPERPLAPAEEREKLTIAAEGMLTASEIASLIADVTRTRHEGPASVAAVLRGVAMT